MLQNASFAPPLMRKRRLSTQFLILGVALLALALLSIGSTMWITQKLEGGAAAVNEAGRLRMQAWRLVSAQFSALDSQRHAQWLAEFDASLSTLEQGVPERPLLVPWNTDTRAHFVAMKHSWAMLKPYVSTSSGNPVVLELTVSEVHRFVDQVDELVLSIERVLIRLGATLKFLQFVMMALAVAGASLALYVGYLYVVFPVQRIREGLGRIQSGDFQARVEPEAHNEFSDLADGFNHMARTLADLYQGLERKVEDKTRDLQGERERLRVLYEVSSFLIDANTLEGIAQGFAQRVRVFSKADAVAVRWSDEASQRYLMLGSDQLPVDLQEEERCIEAGLCACGQPQATARTRVIPIISQQDQRLGTCAKVGYVSLVSVPIRAQDRVIGEVDLFFRQPAQLNEADRTLYDTLAGQLATAVENLRSAALLRETAVSDERSFIARELHDSIAQSLAFLKIQVSMLRQALARQDARQIEATVQEIDVGLRESTSDVRELLVHFRTRASSDDIQLALRTTLQKFEHQSGLKSHLELRGHAIELAPDTQLQVLHVLQEALSNVRKHAGASEVWVLVDKGPPWRLTVRDNGCGFETHNAAPDDTHVGLHIMRERAERIGARLQLRSVPRQGTEVTLELQGD